MHESIPAIPVGDVRETTQRPIPPNDWPASIGVVKQLITQSAVRYDREQGLTEAQKARARENIGVISETIPLDDEVTQGSKNGVTAQGIWLYGRALVSGLASQEEVNRIGVAVKSIKDTAVIKRISRVEDYLYEAYFNALDAQAADAYFKARYLTGSVDDTTLLGACSSIRAGGLFGHNYDWRYDDAVSFVALLPALPTRFGSITMCASPNGVTRSATEAQTVPSELWNMVPFFALDGVNEHGVVCSVNVVPARGDEDEKWQGRDFCAISAVRKVLDTCKTAEEGANLIASGAWMPKAELFGGYSLHFMVADKDKTLVVEDGQIFEGSTEGLVMTNFRVGGKSLAPVVDYDTVAGFDPYGTGVERYNALSEIFGSASVKDAIKSAIYSLAYQTDESGNSLCPSDFAGTATSPSGLPLKVNEVGKIQDWFKRERVNAKWQARIRDGKFWQTVHSSIYDIEARSISVVVQEGATVHEFNLSSTACGTVKSVNGVKPKINGNVTLSADDVPYGGASSVRLALDSKLDRVINKETSVEVGARLVFNDRAKKNQFIWDGRQEGFLALTGPTNGIEFYDGAYLNVSGNGGVAVPDLSKLRIGDWDSGNGLDRILTNALPESTTSKYKATQARAILRGWRVKNPSDVIHAFITKITVTSSDDAESGSPYREDVYLKIVQTKENGTEEPNFAVTSKNSNKILNSSTDYTFEFYPFVIAKDRGFTAYLVDASGEEITEGVKLRVDDNSATAVGKYEYKKGDGGWADKYVAPMTFVHYSVASEETTEKVTKVLACEKRTGDTVECIYDGDTKLTSYTKFLALVQSGRAVLQATATPSSGSSPVLFRPQLMNTNVVLFDATGEISGVMRTRNIQVKRSGTDGIEVVSGGLKQVAMISDIPSPVTLDDTVTEKSANGVKSAGIWSWVKSLGYFVGSIETIKTAFASIFAAKSHKHEIGDINATVFPPESHSHAQSEVEGLEAVLNRRVYLDRIGSGNISLLVTEDGKKCIVINGEQPDQWLELRETGQNEQIAYLRDLADKLTDADLYTLCTACGITTTGKDRAAKLLALFTENTKLPFAAQDVIDFLHYKGNYAAEVAYKKGDVVYGRLGMDEGFFRKDEDSEPGELNFWTFIYAKNEGKTGLERLTDLFGESNSQLVSTIKGEFKVVEYFTDEDGTKHLAYLDNDGMRTSTELTSFAELFALAKMNRVRLYYHAVGDTGRKALYHPHMVDDEASPNPVIRFDATGTLGGKVYTRSIAVTKTSSGGISITPDSLTELAKMSDVPYAVVNDIVNRSVKRVTINSADAMTVVLPKPTASSGVIDFEVWFDASAYEGTYPSIGYKYDATTDADVITKDGEDLAYGDGAVTIVHFTSVNGSAYTAVAASFK